MEAFGAFVPRRAVMSTMTHPWGAIRPNRASINQNESPDNELSGPPNETNVVR